MANAEKVAGVNSYVLYGAESTYGTAAAATLPFGLIRNISPTLKNNLIVSRGFAGSASGGRNAAVVQGGKFEVGLSIEFEPQVFDWMVYVLGGARTGSGTGASPYSYPEANTITSLTIAHDIDNATTDRDMQYLGMLANTCTIRASIGEAVSCTLDFVGASIAKDATVQTNQALSSASPFIFSGGSFELPNGSLISNILDSVEITITNNAEVLYGIGARTGRAGIVKQREYQVKATFKYLDETLIDFFLGSATTVADPTRNATMAIKFSATNKYVDFVFTGVTMEDWAEGASLNEALTEDITFICESLTIGEQQTA